VGAAQQREALRREVLARRDRLPAEARRRLSRAIAERFWGLPEIASARTLHVSLSTGSEVETGDVVAEARRRGLRVVVPVTLVNERRLLLVEFDGLETLAPGPFGIPEPKPEGRKVVDLARVDALVIPGVAFDEHGNRLGWGAGFYDRLLERARPAVPIVALAYECQIIPAVPPEGHDVRVSVIVTEQRIIHARAGSRVVRAGRNPPHPPFAKGGRVGIS
jgi:5-formyltetrahydrofolate cyclo-ligase